MTDRLRRIALVAVVPTAVDITLFVVLRRQLGWILVVADVAAIAVASALSYALHRVVTFRGDPFVRWVRMPMAFVAVALAAAAVDVAVLRGLYAAHGATSVAGLAGLKAIAVGAAAVVRLALYRAVLLGAVRRAIHERQPRPPSPGHLRASVVVPAYEEAAGIAATVSAIHDALDSIRRDGGVEIVVVDDGSSDDTGSVALAAGADQVVVQPHNRGKGAAVRAGVAAARGRTIAFTDADLSYSPDQLLRVIGEVESGWDVAVGSRRHPESSTDVGAGALRGVGSRVINVLATWVLLSHPRDTQCGLKAFRSDVARSIFARTRVDGFAFDIEVLHLVERDELSLVEVPVRLRSDERSSVHVVRDGLRMLGDLRRIRRLASEGAYVPDDGAGSTAGSIEAGGGHH